MPPLRALSATPGPNGSGEYPKTMEDLEPLEAPPSAMDGLEGEALVEAVILRYLREIYENPAIVTGWVIVAEFVDQSGTLALHSSAAYGMPYWKINGMIDAAPREMDYADDDDDLE